MAWFGVKTIYRWKTLGKPRNTDEYYSPNAVLIEERVVLLRAADSDEAIRLAELEAHRYEALEFTNPYGQLVRTEYLGGCNCYELSEDPGHEVEVFSRTELGSKYRSVQSVLDSQVGMEHDNEKRIRRKFQNAEFCK